MDKLKMEYQELERLMQGLELLVVNKTENRADYIWVSDTGQIIIDHWSKAFYSAPYICSVSYIKGGLVYLGPCIPPDNAKDRGYSNKVITAILTCVR